MPVGLIYPVRHPCRMPKMRGSEFYDDFSTDADGTTPTGYTVVTPGVWTVQQRVLQTSSSSAGQLFLNGTENWQDLILEWMVETSVAGDNIELWLRTSPPDSAVNLYYVNVNGSNVWALKKNVGGGHTILAAGGQVPVGTPFLWSLSAVGSVISSTLTPMSGAGTPLALSVIDTSVPGPGPSGIEYSGSSKLTKVYWVRARRL